MIINGKIYLIPIPIADGAIHTLSPEILETSFHVKHFFVENLRTARRFLKSIHPSLVIDEIQFSVIDKHEGPDTGLFKSWVTAGHSIGIMSEAGCPGIADPGAKLVTIAHEMSAQVVPLTGPNSITLALMASGLNGQSFCFHGYLPVKDPARSKKITELEQHSKRENQTQIFIETPYRNKAILSDLLKNCNNNTLLCIAQNITAEDAFIKTQTVSEWKKLNPDLGKTPAVFLMLA